MMEIATTIREYIAQNILFIEENYPYTDSTSFLEEGIIDSLGVMELVVFTEQEFGIAVPDREIIPENFDSVERLTRYIHSKLPGSAKPG